MKLTGIEEIRGIITLESGLHIGAGDMDMKIGGVDNPVIKHPHTNEPYIPGSSIKGKVRSLLEMKSGLMTITDGAPVSINTLGKCDGTQKSECKKILQLFGASGSESDDNRKLGPTRVSFADCPMSRRWLQTCVDRNLALTEVKSENSINRISGTAANPRFTERVPSDAQFDFSVTVKQMEGDDDLVSFLLSGLKLLESDSLGGSGSRGYGRVRFEFDDKAMAEKFNSMRLFEK